MKISDAAHRAGLSTKAVRYYAEIGLVEPIGRAENGFRQYDERCVNKLTFVRRARAFGFSIANCRALLELLDNPRRSNQDVRQIASDHLNAVIEKQRELQTLHDQLFGLIASCQGDGASDCPILDHFSETPRQEKRRKQYQKLRPAI